MRAKRYEIQFAYQDDIVSGNEVEWYTYRSRSSKFRRRAVENWWHVVSNSHARLIYRLVDTKTGIVIR